MGAERPPTSPSTPFALLGLLVCGLLIWNLRPTGHIQFREAAPAGFLDGAAVEFVGVARWGGAFSNASLSGEAELRCTRLPWLRVRRHEWPPPEGYTPDHTHLTWSTDTLSVQVGRARPVVFGHSAVRRLRLCP